MQVDKIIWTTVKRKVKDLKFYQFNPRQIKADQFERLKKSIDELGYAELVAIDTDDTLVAGHMRVRALIALGRSEEEIEVRMPNRKLTEREFKRYLITSNAVMGHYDVDILTSNFDNIDLTDWGVDLSQFGVWDAGEPAELTDTAKKDLKPTMKITFATPQDLELAMAEAEAFCKAHGATLSVSAGEL